MRLFTVRVIFFHWVFPFIEKSLKRKKKKKKTFELKTFSIETFCFHRILLLKTNNGFFQTLGHFWKCDESSSSAFERYLWAFVEVYHYHWQTVIHMLKEMNGSRILWLKKAVGPFKDHYRFQKHCWQPLGIGGCICMLGLP